MLNYSDADTNRMSPAARTSCLNRQFAETCGGLQTTTSGHWAGGRAFICCPRGECLLAAVRSSKPSGFQFQAQGPWVRLGAMATRPWLGRGRCGWGWGGWVGGELLLAPLSHLHRWASQVCSPPDAGTGAARFRGDHTCGSAFLGAPKGPRVHQGFLQDGPKSEAFLNMGPVCSYLSAVFFSSLILLRERLCL